MSADRAWRVREFRSGDEVGLVDLFENVFKRPTTVEHWRWKLRTRPSPVEPVAVAVDLEDRPIFQMGGIPVRFRFGGSERWVMVAVDAMTAPEFRRQGVMGEAGGRLLDSWREAGVALVLGMPNEQHNRATLGWESLLPLRWRVRPLRPARLLARRLGLGGIPGAGALDGGWNRWWGRLEGGGDGPIVREMKAPFEAVDRLWPAIADGLTYSIVRNAEWVRWRYGMAPHRRYKLLLAEREGAPCGFAAYALLDNAGRRSGLIADISASPRDRTTACALIGHVARFAEEAGAETLWTLAVPGGWLDAALRGMGFLFTPGAFDVACVRLDRALSLEALRRREAWCIAGGDFDVV